MISCIVNLCTRDFATGIPDANRAGEDAIGGAMVVSWLTSGGLDVRLFSAGTGNIPRNEERPRASA